MRLGTCKNCGAAGVWVNAAFRECDDGIDCPLGEYCGECFESVLGIGKRRKPSGAGRATMEDDGGPWQQNAVRELEDAP